MNLLEGWANASSYAVYKNGLVYSVNSGTLSIVNFATNPATLLSTLNVAVGASYVIKVKGNYAYIGGGQYFKIVDVSNPSAPVVVGTGSVGGFNISAIVISGNYAYMNAGMSTYKIMVFDISNLSTPVKVSEITGYTEENPDLAVQGNRLYVLEDRNTVHTRMHIYDISNPTTPVALTGVDGYAPSIRPKRIIVEGNYAYVSGYYNGITVYNISADTYVPVGAWNKPSGRDPAWARMCKIGNFIYIGSRYGLTSPATSFLNKIDFSVPTAPVRVEETADFPSEFSVSSNGMLTSWTSTGVNVYDLGLGGVLPKAVLSISSTPAGASISLGGSVIGVTNGSFQVDAGTYTIGLSLAGYDDWSKVVSVDSGEIVTVTAAMTVPTLNAKVTFTSTPTAANIIIDGETVGVTPLLVQLEAGGYSIILQKSGYNTFVTTRNFIEKEIATVDATLVQIPAPPEYSKINDWIQGRGEFVATIGSKIYTNAGDELWIIDATDPANAVKSKVVRYAGFANYGGNINVSMVAANSNAVFIAHQDRVKIVDAATDNVTDLMTPCGGISINGNLLFCAASPNVKVFDVSNINQPVELGTFNIVANLWGAWTKTGCPYLFTYSYGNVKVWQIGVNPFSLTLMSSINGVGGSSSNINDLEYDVNRHVLFLPNYPGPVEFYDLTNPSSPVKVGQWIPASPSWKDSNGVPVPLDRYTKLSIYNATTLIVGQHDWSWMILDITDLSNPVLLSEYWYRTAAPGYTGGYPRDVAFFGHYMVTQNSYNGVHIADISDLTKPTFLKIFMTTGACFDSFYDKITGLMFTSVDMGILVTDWNNVPATLVSHYYYSGRGGGMDKVGDLLFVDSSWAGLKIMDATNPSHLKELSQIYGRGYSEGHIREGNTLYISLGGYTSMKGLILEIYDITDPTKLVLLGGTGGIDNTHSGWQIRKKGNYVYITSGRDGTHERLDTFDVSDKTNPILVNTISEVEIPNWRPMGMLIEGDIMYVSVMYDGMYVFDISNGIPVKIGSYLPGYNHQSRGASPMKVGNLIYLYDITGAVKIDVTDPTHPVKVGLVSIYGDYQPDGRVVTTSDDSGIAIWSAGVLPPEPTTGTILVTSKPNAVNVYSGNTLLGVTPLNIQANVGAYSFTLRKQGYGDYPVSGTISGGDIKNIHIDLSTTPSTLGTLVINSDQPEATIYLNEADVGVTPKTFEVNADTYNLVLRKTGYFDYASVATVMAGQTTTVSAVLTPVPIVPTTGVLDIVSNPVGADIVVGGVEQGHTPFALTLSAGAYEVTLSLAGYYDYVGNQTVVAGETTSMNVTLTELPPPPPTKGAIDVGSTPSGATVSIDGAVVGVTPYSTDMSVGDHQVVVSLDTYVTQTFTASVVAGETYTINATLVKVDVEPPPPEPTDDELIKWGALALLLAYGVSKLYSKGKGLTKAKAKNLLGRL